MSTILLDKTEQMFYYNSKEVLEHVQPVGRGIRNQYTQTMKAINITKGGTMETENKMRLEIADGRDCFYQWDSGQRLVIQGGEGCNEVHFSNSGRGDAAAITCKIREADGAYVADVPNCLLQTAAPITAYLFYSAEDGTQTRMAKNFQVLRRPKPADYVYTEEEKQTYERLEERIADLENAEASPVTPAFSIGNITTLEAGSNATATITGTAERPVLNLGIPKGADGKDANGGESSWNELNDKPFGVVGKGDTLEWDGNPNTPKTLMRCGYPGSEEYDGCFTFYKVSDAVITAEDLVNGAITKLWFESNTDEIGVKECTFANGGIVQKEDGAIWMMAEDANKNQMNGFELYCYPENSTYPAGIYFAADFSMPGAFFRVAGLTIPGYGKFPVAKTIAMDVMPAPLRFGEAEGFSNTLVWDGNTDGLIQDPNEQGWYILSDVVVTAEDMANGIFVEIPAPGIPNVTCAGINTGVFMIDNSDPENITFTTMDENGNECPFMRFTPLGILVTDWYASCTNWETMESIPYYIRLHSLTIPGFNRFPVTVNKTIDKKYLPKAAGVWNCQNDTVSGAEFNELLNSLREAGYLGKV